MRPCPICTALLEVTLATMLGAGPALAGSDVTLTGDHRSGEYGSGSAQDSQSLSLSFVHGERIQFFARLPALRLRSPYGVAVTSVGPVPLSPEHRQARGEPGSPGNGNGSGNGGNPSGGPAKSDSIATDAGSPVESVGGSEWVSGVGDLRVGLAARLVGRPAGLYRLDADLTLKTPTADEDKGLGTGEWDVRVGLMGERRFWTCTAFAALGWNRFGDPLWVDLQDAADFFGGIESESLGPGLMVSGWVNANTEVVPGVGSRVVLGGSLRSSRRTAWKLSLSAGLTDAAEEVGLSFGYTFAGRTPRARAAEVAR